MYHHQPLKLKLLDYNRSGMQPAQFSQLEELFFVTQTCAPLIVHANQVASQQASESRETLYQNIYEVAIEYAIEKDAYQFIKECFLHEEIMRHIDLGLLLQYVRHKSDRALEAQILARLLTSTKSHLTDYDITTEFLQTTSRFFADLTEHLPLSSANDDDAAAMLDHDTIFIANILNNVHIREAHSLYAYVKLWSEYFFRELTKTKNKKALLDRFSRYLPVNTDSLCIVVSTQYGEGLDNENDQDKIWVIDQLITRHSYTTAQLVEALNKINVWQNVSQPLLQKMLSKMDQTHAKYQGYQLFYDCRTLAVSDLPAFVLAHPEILNADSTSAACVHRIISLMDGNGRKIFIEKSISDPDFVLGRLFNQFIYHYDTHTIANFILSPHTVLPSDFLLNLTQKSHVELHTLIPSVLARRDFHLTNTDLFRSLYNLFIDGNRAAIDCLLNYSPAFDLLKQYYTLNGDYELPSAHHGTVIPTVIAWFIAESQRHPDKYKQLYLTVPNQLRKKVLTTPIWSVLDITTPTLRAYMLKTGNTQLLDDIQPRFIRASATTSDVKKYTVYVPALWKNPQALASLRRIQNQVAQTHAERRIKTYLLNAPPVAPTAQASLAARLCRVDTFYFQHQTALPAAAAILTAGKLKTRQHIEGHGLTGSGTGGLTSGGGVPLTDYRSVFSYFTRVPQQNNYSVIVHFPENKKSQQSRFVINAQQFFRENPQVHFVVLNIYQNYVRKAVQLPDGSTLSSTIEHDRDSKPVEIRIDANKDNLLYVIYEKLFEFIFKYYIAPLPAPLRATLTEKLTNPESPEDYQLIHNLLDCLPLEWLVPGDVKLTLSYVERIDIGDETYDLSALRQIALNANEADTLAAIKAISNIERLPFVIIGLLKIALQRKQDNVVRYLAKLNTLREEMSEYIYVPKIVYEIESLAQLLLECCDNEVVYVKYTPNSIRIETTLSQYSNRHGVHHAQMAILHYALDHKNVEGNDALNLLLDDNLTIPFGVNTPFPSLNSIRDALLSYEVTTLLVSQQNTTYYALNNGQLHPITGEGATDSVVALRPDRLFRGDIAYHIKVTVDDANKQISISTSEIATVDHIASTLSGTLGLMKDVIAINNNVVMITMTSHDFIAVLRQHATFYEGINVLTEDGKILLAERSGKGLASAGGHHGDKYHIKNITYGLRSEFGLELREPKTLEKVVTVLASVKTFTKTAITLISASALKPTTEAQHYAQKKNMPIAFKADTDEFDAGSERLLTLADMRNQRFYDVMPLAELCQYQLTAFKKYLEENFSAAYAMMSFQIDDHVDRSANNAMVYKVPSLTFGRIHLTVQGDLPSHLVTVFAKHNATVSSSTASHTEYTFDISPLALIQALRQPAPSPGLSLSF